ncbi:MAG: GGDEF domain-containing protein [Burkholderiales bacterium]|nr:MAG: GGDEF domain-containing protein [Burkholderiales bacterium]TAG80151.1 MAG: GGDEF domain-containing protein [Betaproteobacteria bacterium]
MKNSLNANLLAPIAHPLPPEILRFALDHSFGASVSIIDTDLRLHYVNSGFAKSFETTPEALIGKTLRDIYKPEHVQSFLPHLQRAFAGEHVRYDRSTQVVGSDGIWFTVSLFPWRNERNEVVGVFHCAMRVHDLKLSAEALRVANERVSSHMENSPLTVFELDEGLRITHCSARAALMFGYEPSALTNKPLIDALGIEDSDGAFADAFRRLQTGEETRNRVESSLRHRNGHVVYCDWFNSALTARSGGVISIMSLVQDVSSRVEAAQQLLHFATHDVLTGLGNRRALTERLVQAIARAERTGDAVAVLFIDLDGFKQINDAHGHSAGDAVLREVATRLRAVARASDFVARLGGDEFVILLDAEVGAETASLVAERVLAALSPLISLSAGNAPIGASIGIAMHPPLSNRAVDLIRQADAAMYSAKRAGKGCVRFAEA